MLRSALKQAVRWNFLFGNPADATDLPRQHRATVAVLSVQQARTFVKAIAGHEYEGLFAVATTGMRPSEYLALTWNDIDLDRGTVSISRSLEWRKGGWQFADAKRPRCEASGLGCLGPERAPRENPRRSGDDIVFRAKRGGPIRESHFVQRYFKPLLKTAGLPDIRLYDLRHTAATISLAACVSPKVISKQLGHASVAFKPFRSGTCCRCSRL